MHDDDDDDDDKDLEIIGTVSNKMLVNNSNAGEQKQSATPFSNWSKITKQAGNLNQSSRSKCAPMPPDNVETEPVPPTAALKENVSGARSHSTLATSPSAKEAMDNKAVMVSSIKKLSNEFASSAKPPSGKSMFSTMMSNAGKACAAGALKAKLIATKLNYKKDSVKEDDADGKELDNESESDFEPDDDNDSVDLIAQARHEADIVWVACCWCGSKKEQVNMTATHRKKVALKRLKDGKPLCTINGHRDSMEHPH